MNAIKIKRFKVKRAGTRGFSVTLPQVWVDDVGLKKDDSVDVLRTDDDRLLFVRVPAAECGNPRTTPRVVEVEA